MKKWIEDNDRNHLPRRRRSNEECRCLMIFLEVLKRRQNNNHAPIIVVDGMSVMRFIYQFKDLSWVCGGQLKEYEQILKEFIHSFKNEGAELVFFFDGPHVFSKRETWIKRRLENLNKIYKLFDDLSDGKGLKALDSQLFLLPPNISLVTKLVAKQSGCKVYHSTRECDLEIAEYAFKNKCLAILAQDTDFVIFKGAKYYLSMKNFNIRNLKTFNYDREKLATSIGLRSTDLPLLASLLGNDIISIEELKPFHQRLLSKGQGNYNNRWINFGELIVEVAKFIKAHVNQLQVNHQVLEIIAEKVFNDHSKLDLLEQSILSYDYAAEINRNDGPLLSGDENWKNILRKVFELHKMSIISPTVFGIIAQKLYSCSNGLEDYRLNDLPPSQTILKPLREKLYGLLLSESSESNKVEEWVMCGPNSLDEAVYIEPKNISVGHNGLLSLWRGDTIAQWALIGEIFNVDTFKLRSLPSYLIVPALTLRYLYDKVKFLAWELSALVSSTVLVNFYEVHQLARIPLIEQFKETRAIRLYSLVIRSYSTVIFIFNGIGEPVPLQMTCPLKYQDGKLFQQKYLEASRHVGTFELCDQKNSAFDHYERMMKFITLN